MENENIPEILDNYYILNDDGSRSAAYTLDELVMLKANGIITKDTLIIKDGEDPKPAGTFIDFYNPDITDNSGTKNDKELPQELNTLNFGAFMLAPFWGYSHFPKYKIYWGVFIVIFCLNNLFKIYAHMTTPSPSDYTASELSLMDLSGTIRLITMIIWLITAIIFLVKGNELAWKNRKFKDIEQFKDIQKKWKIWGYTILLFFIFIFMPYIIYMGLLLSYCFFCNI